MKKIISLVALLCVLASTLLLGGCGFFVEESGLLISEIKKTNEFEDGTTELTIYFTDEFVAPVKITIPPGKEGDVGNGIANIKHEYDEDGKQTHLTIEFTKEGVDPVEFDVPDGKTITSITSGYNEITGKFEAYFIFNGNEEDMVTMELPEFSGIKSYTSVTNDDQSVDITFEFNLLDEPLNVHIPAPEKGNGIASMASREENGVYYIDVTFTDPDVEPISLDFNKPADPNSWTAFHGSYTHAENPRVGDYWFDMDAKTIHVRRDGYWELVIAFNDQSTTHEVKFYLNDGVSTSIYTQAYVNHGSYFSSTGRDIPVPPTREGFEFAGWYTKAENINPAVNAPFTDLTPVNDNLNLYARWIELTP